MQLIIESTPFSKRLSPMSRERYRSPNVERLEIASAFWDRMRSLMRSCAIIGTWVCATTPAFTQSLPPEVQVGDRTIIDYEFDWGRNGVYCQACNGGQGNARFAFIDVNHNLWVGNLDVKTGAFNPPNGQGVLVDQNAATDPECGNGPEWMISQRGSELVYTRWLDGLPHDPENMSLGFARMTQGLWLGGALAGTQERAIPIGTLNPNASTPSIQYQDVVPTSSRGKVQLGTQLYWRALTNSESVEHPIPIATTDPNIARRWIPNSSNIIVTAPVAPDASGNVYRQVLIYHTLTNTVDQLTYDPVDKKTAWMWQAPEYGNEYVFFAVSGESQINIYRYLPNSDGVYRWAVVNSINAPFDAPYIASPEPFVFNGRSWIMLTLGSGPSQFSVSLVALTGIVPGNSLKRLTAANNPPRARKDPEYFITANGPYIYYNRYIPATAGQPEKGEGVFRVDTGLGPIATGP